MPTYDYLCASCGYRFEKFESMAAKPAKKCPECKKMKLNRLIGTGAGLIFKGSGFYETDYRSESYKKGESKAKSASTSSTGKKDKKDTATKSETKPAKTESKTPAKKD